MIGFTVFVMVVFETFKWWRGDGNYNDYEYSLCDYVVKNIVCRGNKILHN